MSFWQQWSWQQEEEDPAEQGCEDAAMYIGRELRRMSEDALTLIMETIQPRGVLQYIFAPIVQTLLDLQQTPVDDLARPTFDDGFEARIAQALLQVRRSMDMAATHVAAI